MADRAGMRTFTLASLAATPVVVGIVLASGTAAAAPAGPAGKRIARRPATTASATAARPLPAPLPKDEVLPPLPPVARDVTAIATLPSAPAPDWTSGGGAGVGTTPSTAASETLPALSPGEPSSSVAGAPASPDVVKSADKAGREVAPSGWVFQLGTGVLAPTSPFIPGLRTLGPGAAFDARLGYYAGAHVGLLVGVRGSYGHTLPGCSGCDAGYSYQLPVMLQLAAIDRTRGVYVDAGVGLGTTYGGKAGSSASYTMTSAVEAKLGLGYRFGSAGAARSATSFDLNLGVDVGAIDNVEVTTGNGKTSSASGDAPTHAVVAVSLVIHFSL